MAYVEKRPWGEFEQFTTNERCTVKIIRVEPNQRLSLQFHHHRDEYWKVVFGSGFVVIGNEQRTAKVTDEFVIVRRVPHRLEAGPDGIVVLEIARGDFDENDIVRIEDDHGRM